MTAAQKASRASAAVGSAAAWSSASTPRLTPLHAAATADRAAARPAWLVPALSRRACLLRWPCGRSVPSLQENAAASDRVQGMLLSGCLMCIVFSWLATCVGIWPSKRLATV